MLLCLNGKEVTRITKELNAIVEKNRAIEQRVSSIHRKIESSDKPFPEIAKAIDDHAQSITELLVGSQMALAAILYTMGLTAPIVRGETSFVEP